MKTHYVIPIFIPEKACPFRCVYCNQYHISATLQSPMPEEITKTIDTYLQHMPPHAFKRIAFFGGSFTGMSIDEQNQYLDLTLPYIEKGLIDEIQLSTRPDYITPQILVNLKQFHVGIIELGAQSLKDDVLKQANRGHTVRDVEVASQLIRQYGFKLGLQMMIGLPGDSYDKAMFTANKIIEWGADYTRIYPALVIKDTELAQLYLNKQYTPLPLDEAVRWCNDLLDLFIKHNVNILRIGLHPSEGLINATHLLAGPFHVSFKELVLSAWWAEHFYKKIGEQRGNSIVISVNSKQVNAAIGYKRQNKNNLLSQFKFVTYILDDSLHMWESNYTIH